MKLIELRPYLYSLGKYEEEVITGTLRAIGTDTTVDYLQLRPNGITTWRSNGESLESMRERGYKFQDDWIKVEHEEHLVKHKKNGKPE